MERGGTTPDQDNFNIGLGAVLIVCTVAGEDAGLHWAEELWSWAEKQRFTIFPMQYNIMARVWEESGCYDRVDDMLRAAKIGQQWVPNVVLLGALLNTAARRNTLRRGEHHWDLLTTSYGIKPNVIAISARAKLHLLCGRPQTVVQVTSEAKELNVHLFTSLLQASVVICHSSLSKLDLQRLNEALQLVGPIMQDARKRAQLDFKSFKLLAERLRKSPDTLGIKDLLITTNGKESVMATWKGCRAGSKYLASE